MGGSGRGGAEVGEGPETGCRFGRVGDPHDRACWSGSGVPMGPAQAAKGAGACGEAFTRHKAVGSVVFVPVPGRKCSCSFRASRSAARKRS